MSTLAINPGYEAIVKKAEEIGWPEDFRDDLFVHDRGMLEEWHGPFGWSVRQTGTWMVRPMLSDCAKWADTISNKNCMGTPRRLFIWDGSKLSEVDADKFCRYFSDLASKLPTFNVKISYRVYATQPYRKTEHVLVRAHNADYAMVEAVRVKSRNYFDVKSEGLVE